MGVVRGSGFLWTASPWPGWPATFQTHLGRPVVFRSGGSVAAKCSTSCPQVS